MDRRRRGRVSLRSARGLGSAARRPVHVLRPLQQYGQWRSPPGDGQDGQEPIGVQERLRPDRRGRPHGGIGRRAPAHRGGCSMVDCSQRGGARCEQAAMSQRAKGRSQRQGPVRRRPRLEFGPPYVTTARPVGAPGRPPLQRVGRPAGLQACRHRYDPSGPAPPAARPEADLRLSSSLSFPSRLRLGPCGYNARP